LVRNLITPTLTLPPRGGGNYILNANNLVLSLIRAFMLVLLTAGLSLSSSGCHKLKDLAGMARPGEVSQKSYPIKAYKYHLSLVIHGSPEEFMNYFATDMLWLEKRADILVVDTSRLKTDTDMTEPGQSIEFSFRMLGFEFPCQVTCLKYLPDKELWWMMSLGYDAWVLFRIEMNPCPAGCCLNVKVLGQLPKYLDPLLDSFNLVEAAALRAELVMTLIQAEFDPDLDIDKETEGGMRGEVHETFLEGYESFIRIESNPQELAEWIFKDPDTLNSLIPNLRLGGVCLEDTWSIYNYAEETIYCPSKYVLAGTPRPAIVLTEGYWEEEDRMNSYSHYFWLIVLDTLIRAQLDVEKRVHGSRLKMIYASELPASQAPESTDLMVEIADIPERLEEILIYIKKDFEDGAISSSNNN
jgi:hypothetical protein